MRKADMEIGSGQTRRVRLVAVETHPIQYKVPLFRLLAQRDGLDLTVMYALLPDTSQQGTGFGVPFVWDIPLLEGYRHDVLVNRARAPSVIRFGGCDTPDIYKRLRRERPDAVLVNGWVTKTCLQALWACRRLGIPCLVRGEANLLRPRAWWKHVLHGCLLRQYSAYLAIGSANRAFYRFHRCAEDRISLAPYSVDNDWFAGEAAKRSGCRQALRDRFGIPSDAVVFLFVGKLEEKKHPMDVLVALAALTPPHPAYLLVVGDGPLRGECESFATARHLPVRFTGFQNQSALPDAYAVSDVLVLPSDAGETWGLVVNEAMASGRPAIVSRSAGCCADLIIEADTGYAFDLHDVACLSTRMADYINTPGLAARHGENAVRHIVDYSVSRTADGVMEALRRIPGRAPEGKSC